MRQYIPAIVAGLIAGAVPGGYAVWHKPAPTIVQPQTTIVSRGPALPIKGAPGVTVKMGDVPIVTGDGAAPALTRSEQRQLAASWGELDQKEVDALSAALAKIERKPLDIFCFDDSLCGDMQLDFDNAFETAHWETKLEKPVFDIAAGIVTTREDIRAAINEATSGRLDVKLGPQNAATDYLVIGKRNVAKKGVDK